MADKTPSWTHDGGPLDCVNDAFHRAYDSARRREEDRAPVLVFLGEVLALHQGPERREQAVNAPGFFAIRSAAHAPLAAFSMLGAGVPAPARLRALQERLSAVNNLDGMGLEPTAASDVRKTLALTQELLATVLAEGQAAHPPVAAFARRVGPLLLRLTEHGTRAQLGALHRAARALLQGMDSAALKVVVAGAHQARQRSLGMQYFQKLLGEPPGQEERVIYAENVVDEAGALALVGTHRLDRALAEAFFGDPKRLQRDVLGDAAAAQLDTFDWSGG